MSTIVARSPSFKFRVVATADDSGPFAIEHFRADLYPAGPDPLPSQWVAPATPWRVVEPGLATEKAAVDRMAVWESRL